MPKRNTITYDPSEFVTNLKSLTTTIAEGVVVTDEKKNIIWVNKLFEKICGYTLEEMIGRKPKILRGEYADNNSFKTIQKALDNKKTINTEIFNHRSDGTPYWVNINITPVYNNKKEIANFIAFVHDITEEKKKTFAVEESERLYKSLFEENPEIMFIFDPDTYRILEANNTALKIYGYTKKEFLNLTVKDIRPESDWKKVKKIISDVKDRYIVQGVWKHIKKNGEEILVEVKATRIIYKNKKAILVIPTDVTEKIKSKDKIKFLNKDLHKLNKELIRNLNQTRQLHQDLKSNNKKLNQIRDAAKIGVWEINFENLEIHCSEEVYNIFGFSKKSKLTFEIFRNKVHKEDLEKYDSAINNLLNFSIPLNVEYRIELKGGVLKHLVSKGAMIMDENDKPELFSGITIDVTEKKHDAQIIAEQFKNINIILSSITDPFFIIDKDYNLLYINDISVKLSGFSREQILGKSIWDVYPHRDFEQEKLEYAKALKDKKTYTFETEYFGRSFSVTLYPSELGLAVSAKDITENKRIMNELIDKAKFINEIGDNTPGGIIQTVYKPQGEVEVRYISAGFEDLWGIPIEEIELNPERRFESIHPEDKKIIKKEVLNSIKYLKPINHKFRYINQKTGEIKWVRANTVPTKMPNGNVVLNGVFLDITESQKYYEELEKSNKRYEYVSRATNETIWELDLETNIVELSGNYKEMFGYDFPENKVDFDFIYSRIHPDDLKVITENIQRGLSDYENNYRETNYRMFKKDGSIIHIANRSYTIFDYLTKEPLKIVGSTQDVTQKKKHEASLKEQAKFIKHISDNIPGGIFESIYYPDGKSKLVYASEGFVELWGIPIEKVMENPELRFLPIHEEDLEFTQREIKKCLGNLTPLNIKFRFVNQKTGKVSWIRSKCHTSKNEDGTIILFGLMIDVTDTEKYYNELENSNKRFEYLSKASNEIIWEVDLKTMVTTFGGNYEKILGCSFANDKADFETRKNFIYPEDLEIAMKTIEDAIANPQKSNWEIYFRLVSKEGTIKHIFEKGYIIYDKKTGKPATAIGSTMDITEKKKAEDETKEHAKFLKEISDSMEGFIFQTEYDKDFNVRLNYASEKAKEYWGISVEEAKKSYSKTINNMYEEDIERVKEERLKAAKNLTTFDYKFRYNDKENGGVKWVRAVAVPSKLPNGHVIFNGTVIDITEAEKFYRELEKSNQRYEYVSQAANEAIWDLDLKTKIFTFGGSYKELFGYQFENDVCHNDEIIEITHPDDRERIYDSVEAVMNDSNKNYWEDYYRIVKQDGSIVYAYDRGYVIRDKITNEPIRFVGVTQDITQQKLYEEALKEHVRKVNVIIESLTDPFFVISKDLKVVIVNSAALKFIKRPYKEIIGSSIYDFPYLKNHIVLFDLFKKSILENKTYHEEHKISGTWFDILLYPSEIGLAVYTKDITEKKKRQEELQQNARFISEISESTPGFLFQFEFDKNLKPKLNYASEKAVEFWGVSAKEAVEGSEGLFSAVHEDDKMPFIASVKESITNLHNLNIKYRLINKVTKDCKWVRAAAIPSRLDNGHTLLSGTVIDITEAEQFYNQLEEANERYENVSNAINNAIWELDIRTGKCVMGGAYEQMYGYKLKDNILTEEFHKKLLHPEDYDVMTKAKEEALSDKNKRNWERAYRIIRADGEIIHVNDRAYIVYDEKSQMPIKIIGSTQDITDKVKHDAEQQKNQKFLKEISDSIDGFVFQLEFDKSKKPRLNYMSEKADHFTGVNVKEALKGKTAVFRSIYQEDSPLLEKAVLESLSKLTPLNIKFRQINKTTNEIFTVRASAVPSLLENGNTILNGVVIDITESENYYNKLEEITRRYEYISKASNEAIWEMDVKTQEIILGGGYREMLGAEFPENKITYSEWQGLIHPDDLNRIEKSMNDTIINGTNKYWETNFRIINKDKKIIDVFERAFIVYDEETNAPIKIIGSTQDITQLNKMRVERENMIDDLVNRNKALEQFTYMVSHNLRAPIANILGISYLLEENPDEKTQTEMHQLIKESSAKLDSVIRDMNEILSIKKGYDEEKTDVMFEDILNEVKETQRELISKSGVQIISDFTQAEYIKSIKGYLYSIFQNLISNAIKYRNGKIPKIKITSSANEQYVLLSFEDNGIGIDLEKNAGKIFGLYSKFHLNKEGKGMGLFMVKNQVESLGGEIQVKSKVNEGTTFTIKLKK